MSFELRSVSKVFASNNGAVTALQDVSFGVRGREFVSVVGPSGCGKTTLLKIIAGLVAPSSGEIVYGERPAPGRLRCALVFQEHGMLPWCTVL